MAGSTTSGGKGASATQDKQQATDTALKNERGQTAGSNKPAVADDAEKFGGTEPLPYPEPETLDKVTYRDPRPLDWPQKADRSVYIGPVQILDPEDDGSEKKGYVYAGQVREDEELEVGGDAVEDFQIVASGSHFNVIINGKAYVFGALSGALLSEATQAINVASNS